MASKRRLRRIGCTGKRLFSEERFARYAAFIANRRTVDRHRGAFHAYKCPFGGHFHIGHSGAAFATAHEIARP